MTEPSLLVLTVGEFGDRVGARLAQRYPAVVVKVLVPGLMPVSFDQHARYLAHPRLYEAPARMGHPVTPEADLNPLPQPFA